MTDSTSMLLHTQYKFALRLCISFARRSPLDGKSSCIPSRGSRLKTKALTNATTSYTVSVGIRRAVVPPNKTKLNLIVQVKSHCDDSIILLGQ